MSKRFTAQEMRDILNQSWHDTSRETVHDIIRQAAEDEERFASLTAERDKFQRAYMSLITGGGKTYAELEAENKKLKADRAKLRRVREIAECHCWGKEILEVTK